MRRRVPHSTLSSVDQLAVDCIRDEGAGQVLQETSEGIGQRNHIILVQIHGDRIWEDKRGELWCSWSLSMTEPAMWGHKLGLWESLLQPRLSLPFFIGHQKGQKLSEKLKLCYHQHIWNTLKDKKWDAAQICSKYNVVTPGSWQKPLHHHVAKPSPLHTKWFKFRLTDHILTEEVLCTRQQQIFIKDLDDETT